jgi:peptidoglycan/xylan/chitin deacetylase (PgdA/CDA1 family)
LTYKNLQIYFIAALLVLVVLSSINGQYLWYLLVLGVIYLGLISWGASNIRSGYFLKTLSHGSKPNQIALTFDDGPHPNSLKVLEVLKQHEAKATFFCIGKNLETHPEIARQMLAEGHMLGNHTYSHPIKWGWLSVDAVKQEVEKGEQALKALTGSDSKLFRPPFGVTNPNIARVLNSIDGYVIGWDLRSLDTAIKDEERLYNRIIKKISRSSILLFHDTQEHTPRVVARVLEYCKEHGIKIVSLGELLEIETQSPL